MSIWTKTRPRYEPRIKVNTALDYWSVCPECGDHVFINGDDCKCLTHGQVTAVKVACGHLDEFKEQLRIRDEMVSAIQPTIEAIKLALSVAGDGEIPHPVEWATELEADYEKTDSAADFPTYDQLINGAKFTNEHRAHIHKTWNERYR